MKLFVPGEEDAETAWERMRQACGAPDARPLYSITHDDDGTEVGVTVGEDGVIAIVFGEAFYIFEAASRRPVPWQSVTEMVFFDEE
jgi:hypothetical protein